MASILRHGLMWCTCIQPVWAMGPVQGLTWPENAPTAPKTLVDMHLGQRGL